jgi:hypothetical protein
VPDGCGSGGGSSAVKMLMRVSINRLRMYLGAFVYQPENILIIPNVQVRVGGWMGVDVCVRCLLACANRRGWDTTCSLRA